MVFLIITFLAFFSFFVIFLTKKCKVLRWLLIFISLISAVDWRMKTTRNLINYIKSIKIKVWILSWCYFFMPAILTTIKKFNCNNQVSRKFSLELPSIDEVFFLLVIKFILFCFCNSLIFMRRTRIPSVL